MKKKFIISMVAALSICGFLYFGLKSGTDNKSIAVKTTVVETGDVYNYLSTTGTVKSNVVKEYVGPQGKISKVHVSVGDEVKKGQVLVEFDVDDLSTVVKQAEIQYNSALLSKQNLENTDASIKSQREKIDAEIANIDSKINGINLDDNPDLIGEVATLKVERESLVSAKRKLTYVSKEQYAQVEDTIELAKMTLDKAKKASANVQKTIVAETDGVVTSLSAIEGNISNGVQPLVTVQNLNDLKLVLNVSKYDAQYIKEGLPAFIDTRNGLVKGVVSFVSPTAQSIVGASGTSSYLVVEVDLENYNDSLIVDFDEDVDILIEKSEGVIKLPYEAIKFDKQGNSYVYVVDDNNFVIEKKIIIGVQSDMEVEVKDGLSVNEKVILNPTTDIVNGISVSVVN